MTDTSEPRPDRPYQNTSNEVLFRQLAVLRQEIHDLWQQLDGKVAIQSEILREIDLRY